MVGSFLHNWERKQPQRKWQRKRHSKLKWILVVSNINSIIQIIPSRAVCQMLANFPGSEFLMTMHIQVQRKKKEKQRLVFTCTSSMKFESL